MSGELLLVNRFCKLINDINHPDVTVLNFVYLRNLYKIMPPSDLRVTHVRHFMRPSVSAQEEMKWQVALQNTLV